MPTIEVSQPEADLLCDFIDLYLGQMEVAKEMTVTDHTIETFDDLLSIQGQYQEQEELLKRLKHQLRGCCGQTG